MEHRIRGLHHITCIASDAKRNLKFYTGILGLRFIKKTVNFDDPKTYHFYFGNTTGNAGTILTFFPWGAGIPQGRNGAGMATEIGYAIPKGSLDFWLARFEEFNVKYTLPSKKFGESYVTFLDPDGLRLELIETEDQREPWIAKGISDHQAIRGFQHITLTLNDIHATANILTDIFEYDLKGKEGNRYRFQTDAIAGATIVDLVELPSEMKGHVANGTIHHVAFSVKDDETLLFFRKKVEAAGIKITPQIDRNYFHSLYFREPNGVLFEIATEQPGFLVDESLENLGTTLKLPARYEGMRKEIEGRLVKLN